MFFIIATMCEDPEVHKFIKNKTPGRVEETLFPSVSVWVWCKKPRNYTHLILLTRIIFFNCQFWHFSHYLEIRNIAFHLLMALFNSYLCAHLHLLLVHLLFSFFFATISNVKQLLAFLCLFVMPDDISNSTS